MTLTVAAYDASEKEAEENCCNRVIEASKPETFLIRGYPTRITKDEDVWRFIDVMHELGEQSAYDQLLGGLTEAEFDLFKSITQGVADLTRRKYGRLILPKGALARAFVSFRHIGFISEPGATIFELGSGSGYLGLLLGLSGYSYGATEITQGFYLAQSILWEHFFGSGFIELANSDSKFTDFERLSPGTVIHVPWWKFSIPNAEQIKFQSDVVTANHALCEMHTTAFKYTLRLGARMLGASDGIKYFFVEGPGADDLRNHQQMCEGFNAAGLTSVFADFPIDIFAPAHHGDAIYIDGVPTPQVVTTKRKWPFGGSAQASLMSESPAKISKVAARVTAGRQALANAPRVPFSEIRAFQSKVAAGEPLFTEDELFLRFAYGTDNW